MTPAALPVAALVRLALALVAAALPAAAQPADEVEFARVFLGRLQLQTIVEDREFCGYFGRTTDGRIVATRPRRGKYNTCFMDYPPAALKVFASYHTHAAYDSLSYNEIPSPQDLKSDIEDKIDGYVSTPGGRLWFSDHLAGEVRLVCGEDCLPSDPVYRPGKAEKVRPRYSLDDLVDLMGE